MLVNNVLAPYVQPHSTLPGNLSNWSYPPSFSLLILPLLAVAYFLMIARHWSKL